MKEEQIIEVARELFHKFGFKKVSMDEIAREAGVKRLLLNHISARFLSKDIGQMRRDASSIFKNVHLVKDLEEVEL